MNYYIQGNKEKADQIRAAFEKLGYDTAGWNYKSDRGIYFTNESDKSVEHTSNEIFANLIKTHPDCKELKLPVEFKDGDIIGFNDCTHNDGSYVDWVGIYKEKADTEKSHFFHCVITSKKVFRIGILSWRVFTAYPATKEQRDLLFQKMKEAGYEWDADKKELKKIQPHYDISNFYAGMPVLVRDNNGEEWRHTAFSHMTSRFYENKFAAGCTYWCQCIPYNDDTKHLLGTTNMCEEKYINW